VSAVPPLVEVLIIINLKLFDSIVTFLDTQFENAASQHFFLVQMLCRAFQFPPFLSDFFRFSRISDNDFLMFAEIRRMGFLAAISLPCGSSSHE